MLKNETMKIIAICKGFTKYKNGTVNEWLKTFAEEEYLMEKEYLIDEFIEAMLVRAMYDYIDNCDTPSDFLRTFLIIHQSKPLIESISDTFTEQKVCKIDRKTYKKTYINGFDERYEEIFNDLK